MKYLLLLLFTVPSSLFCQEDYISNKDYNEFVTYVRDSLLRQTMGEEIDEEGYLIMEQNLNSNHWQTIGINWKTKLDLNWGESREALEPFYYKPSERLNRRREFDTRKFIHNGVRIYPDELVWCRDSTINKSWATFLTKYYYAHPYFEDYPVQGVSDKQLQQYVRWKDPQGNLKDISRNTKNINLKLPKEKLHLTSRDYFEFYKYTRDSIIRMMLCEEYDEERYCLSVNKYDEEIKPPIVKWKHKIEWREPYVYEGLFNFKLISSEEDLEIDNEKINMTYSTFDYYKAILFPDTIKRTEYIRFDTVNVWCIDYLEKRSPIFLEKPKKNIEIIYKCFKVEQLNAFYHWVRREYPTKDVFEGFIPHEVDLQLLRDGKLRDDFYSFKYSISTIQIK